MTDVPKNISEAFHIPDEYNWEDFSREEQISYAYAWGFIDAANEVGTSRYFPVNTDKDPKAIAAAYQMGWADGKN